MIRIMYCYPEEIYDELVKTIANEKKICKYIDMPIQHCNDEVLRRMGRKTNKEELLDRINMLRKSIKGVTLRTTLITGFPGETEEQHNEMIEFVKNVKFDRLGVFAYSPEEDTVAASMPNQIEDETKQKWLDEIMITQQKVAFAKGHKLIGNRLNAIIEGKLTDEDVYVGRTYMDAPEIDGNVFIKTDMELISGDIVNIVITASKEYDLIGEVE